jgi:hypothetical protein
LARLNVARPMATPPRKFALEAFASQRLAGDGFRQYLQRHVAVQTRIVRLVDLADAARSGHGDDLVRSEPACRRQRHGRKLAHKLYRLTRGGITADAGVTYRANDAFVVDRRPVTSRRGHIDGHTRGDAKCVSQTLATEPVPLRCELLDEAPWKPGAAHQVWMRCQKLAENCRSLIPAKDV